MFPIAMLALSLAQKKAQNEQNDINKLNQNGSMDQNNGNANTLSSLAKIYSLFGK